MLEPRLLCNQHLLGEHHELHTIASSVMKKRYNLIKAMEERGFIHVGSVRKRHKDLVREMVTRGMNHKSPMSLCCKKNLLTTPNLVDIDRNLRDLFGRCLSCRDRISPPETS
jgi:hypothetical protein